MAPSRRSHQKHTATSQIVSKLSSRIHVVTRQIDYVFLNFISSLPSSIQQQFQTPFRRFISAISILVSFFIIIIIFLFFRSSIPTTSIIHEFRITPLLYTDSDLRDPFDITSIKSISNLTIVDTILHFDATLTNNNHAQLTIFSPTTHPCDKVPNIDPQLHQLSSLLSQDIFILPSYPVSFPIPPDPHLCDRHTSREFMRACGYKSWSKVPPGSCLQARLIPNNTEYTSVSTLNMPAIEPYDWELTLPSSTECGNGGTVEKVVCRRLLYILIVTYLGGCAPIGNFDVFTSVSNPAVWKHHFMLATPRKCFDGSAGHANLTKDILIKYLQAVCELPKGLITKVRGIVGLSWGVGSRAKELVRLVKRDDGNVLCKEGWNLY